MEHYTLARVTSLNGNTGGQYILYTLDKTPMSRSNHNISPELPKLIAKYLSIVREEFSTVLSTKPNEQFISLSIGNKKTATLRLEELLDTEKKEVENVIRQAEQ